MAFRITVEEVTESNENGVVMQNHRRMCEFIVNKPVDIADLSAFVYGGKVRRKRKAAEKKT